MYQNFLTKSKNNNLVHLLCIWSWGISVKKGIMTSQAISYRLLPLRHLLLSYLLFPLQPRLLQQFKIVCALFIFIFLSTLDTYRARSKRETATSAAYDAELAQKEILREFGPRACILEEPCRLHASRPGRFGVQQHPAWNEILRYVTSKCLSESSVSVEMNGFGVFLEVFLSCTSEMNRLQQFGDILRTRIGKICKHLLWKFTLNEINTYADLPFVSSIQLLVVVWSVIFKDSF